MRAVITWILQIRTTDEDTLRRGRVTIVVALCMLVVALMAVPLTMLTESGSGGISILLGLFGFLGAIALVRAGYANGGGLLLIGFIIIPITNAIATNSATGLPPTTGFYLILPILIGGLILRPALVWLVLVANLIVQAVLWALIPSLSIMDPANRYIQLHVLFLQVVTALFSFFGAQLNARSLVESRRAGEAAQLSARELSRLNIDLERRVDERTRALQSALDTLQSQADAQARLIAENEQQRTAIRELSVPVLPVSSSVLVMPLVGAFDTGRLTDVQTEALRHIAQSQARELLIDVTGVPVIDTQVAKGLMLVVESAKLMGVQVTLVGIRPEVAQTIVGLGLNLQGIRTFSSLQSALKVLRT